MNAQELFDHIASQIDPETCEYCPFGDLYQHKCLLFGVRLKDTDYKQCKPCVDTFCKENEE